ncbi:MAG: thioredoxin domain-containing protein [Patescibacteria group bacterium]
MEENTQTTKSILTMPVAIIIAGILIAGAVYFKGGVPNQVVDNQFKVENKKTTLKPVSADDHILGNPDAELVVIEFSDTECPFCKNFHQTMLQLINEYGKDGKVAWVYRHMPIEQLHSKAKKEAEATECAAKIGGKSKFWDYVNAIFEITPSNDGLDLAKLPEIATQIGLNRAEFERCLSSGEFTEKINQSIADASLAGAQGTPYSIIVSKSGETYPVEGAIPYIALKSIVDGLLKGK